MSAKLLIKVRITAIEDVTASIRRVRMAPVKRAALPRFRGGDHTIVALPNGLRRPFSLVSDPEETAFWEIAVLREAESLGGSVWIHETAEVGTELFTSYPQTGMRLDPGSRRHVLVAGGIGITPFLSMVPEAARTGADVELHWCVRRREDAPFAEAIEAAGLAPGRLHLHVAEEGGRADLEALIAAADPAGTSLYCCGPPRMIDAFLAATSDRPDDRVFVEHFVGLTPAEARQGDPFEIRIASTGEVFAVPADRSILDVLRGAGQDVVGMCEAGACGTCVVRWTDGWPLHRDLCLTPSARLTKVATCVSRSSTLLTLDI